MKSAITVVVMGVCGSGKSLIGERIAAQLGAAMIEGDDHHPPENIQLMKAGIPLTDENRQGWLAALSELIAAARRQDRSLVVSCSALKRKYREQLRQGDPDLRIVYLHGERALIEQRMNARTGHFMPKALLDSQFRDLEAPAADEQAIVCAVADTPDAIVQKALDALRANHGE